MDLDETFYTLVHERLQSGGNLGITIVGHISRTHFEDKRTLVDLLEPFLNHDPNMFVSIHGAFGFDLMVEETALLMGVNVRSNAKDLRVDRKDRFGYQTIHAYDLYAETAAIVVLTRRKKPKEVWEVDPHVMDSAVDQGMPVFSLDVEGVMKLWP